MRRPTTLTLAVLGSLLAIGIGLFFWMVRYGFSAHDQPTSVERWIARTVRQWAVPADLRNEKNPLPQTAEVLAEARSHWADHCAVCHGNDGKGQTAMGRQMYPKAPDMTRPATQSLSDGELFSIIENGIRLTGMPGWGDGTAESAYGSWTLVHFIRHLPAVTVAELEQMSRMNPISRAELEEQMENEAFLEGGDHETADQHQH